MKKKYLIPEAEAYPLSIDGDIMTVSYTGKSTTNLTIVDVTDEDDWVY